MITPKKTLELRRGAAPLPEMFHLILPQVGLHSPPPQTATSLHDVATRGPCQVPPTGLGRGASRAGWGHGRTKLVCLLMAGGRSPWKFGIVAIPGATRGCILVSCFIFRGEVLRGAGRNGKMDRIHHGVCQAASPFSGVFWVPEGESPTGDGHLTPETTGVVPFCLLVFLLLL